MNDTRSPKPRNLRKTELAATPILIGPANALATTGHEWRYVREVLARLPGVRVIKSGDRIVGVIAADVTIHGASTLDTPAIAEEVEEPEQPMTGDAVLALIGRRRIAGGAR